MSQNQSLWPSVTYNETRMASDDFCTEDSPPNCTNAEYTHGHFSLVSSSQSYMDTPSYTPLDDASTVANFDVKHVSDTLNLFTHYFDPSPPTQINVPDYPITVLSNSTSDKDVFFNSGSLGLSSSSTVLAHLKNNGTIDRSVVGFYLGTAYHRAAGTQNGSIVMGGYDAGRMVGEQHKYPLVPAPAPNASPLKVHVKQMSLVTEDGSSIALVTDDGFDGYISTNQYEMELPSEIANILSEALEASPADDNVDNAPLRLAKPFDGNLTITLEDGYQITYPSEWVSNVSNMTPFASSTGNNSSNTTSLSSTRPLIFGAAFLQHLYTTIDYDAGCFYLADAKPFGYYVQPRSLCADQVPVPVGNPKIGKFLQTGAIGAVVGGLIGGAALVWVIYFFARKRLQRTASKKTMDDMEMGNVKGEKGGEMPAPKKSSLRAKAKAGVLTLGKGKHSNSDEGNREKNVKRISWAPSTVSPVPRNAKASNVTVTSVASQGLPKYNELYETKDGRDATNGTAQLQKKTAAISSSLSSSPALQQQHSEVPQLQINGISTTTTTTTNPYRPDQSESREMYLATPLRTPLTAMTPRTSNPLLGNHPRDYVNFDDADDSDIPEHHRIQPQPQPQTTTGELTLFPTASNPKRAKPKPPALPLLINPPALANGPPGPDMSSPTSIRSTASHYSARRHSILRKVFPA